MRSGIVLTVFLLVLALGCGGDQSTNGDWQVVASQDLSPDQEQMQTRAVAARDALFSQLAGRLTTAVAEAGPAAAIAVCAEQAPLIAAEVSQAHNLTIGRSSFRLRNSKNTMPAWAAPHVEARVAEETYLAGPSGELGALLPIRMNSMCVTCHGTVAEIPAEVQSALAEKYPEDEATGFAAGDLRGWFWIEVLEP